MSLKAIISDYCDISNEVVSNFATSYKQDEAIYHTFCVASALDSLVVGESQIVGQLKDAFKYAHNNGYASKALKNLITYAIKCGAKVRDKTKLGSGSLSISSVAVKNAKQLIVKNNNVNVLVIGAGKMGMLAISHLSKSNFNISLCSRNIQNAKDALQKKSNKKEYQNINIIPYSDLNNVLNQYILIFSATSANEAIISKDMLKQHANKANRYWFDLALPRDISDDIYKCSNSYNLKVYSVDDLSNYINENSAKKEKSAKQALKIVSKELISFKIWLRNITLKPLLKNIYVQNEQIAKQKLNQAIKKGYIVNKDKNIENTSKLIDTINKRVFHNLSTYLKKNKISQNKIEFVQHLFK
jgi:glutamyl-tRNA reductase